MQKSQLHQVVFPLLESSLSVASSSSDPELYRLGSKEYGSSSAINLCVLTTKKVKYCVETLQCAMTSQNGSRHSFFGSNRKKKQTKWQTFKLEKTTKDFAQIQGLSRWKRILPIFFLRKGRYISTIIRQKKVIF